MFILILLYWITSVGGEVGVLCCIPDVCQVEEKDNDLNTAGVEPVSRKRRNDYVAEPRMCRCLVSVWWHTIVTIVSEKEEPRLVIVYNHCLPHCVWGQQVRCVLFRSILEKGRIFS